MSVTASHSEKEYFSLTDARLVRMVTVFSAAHWSNEPLPNAVTEAGMVRLVSPLHSRKAKSPTFVTELEIVTLFRPLQPSKA